MDCHVKYINCLIYGNTASGGGAAFDYNNATPTYTNCTITGNISTQNGGGIHTYESAAPILNNCIVWNNDALSAGDEFYSLSGTSSVTANYCVISNDTNDIYGTFNSTQTIYTDPLFANAAASNYLLLSGSPALNSGSTSLFTDAAASVDLAGQPRLKGAAIDMGVYESNTVHYVRQGGSGNGSLWAGASGSLQAMINASDAGNEVWVAAGIYTNAVNQSINMKEGVKIYGGFPATGNPGIHNRNWSTNETVLRWNSASLVGNMNIIRNQGNGLTNAALLDSFTVRDGHANYGAAIYNYQSYPTIANCIIRNNTAEYYGGGMYNFGPGSTLVTNTLFYNNYGAAQGGGVADDDFAATKYYNVTFAKNYAAQGGGSYKTGANTVTGYNCIFWGNTNDASNFGKQIFVTGKVTMNNSIIQNSATEVSVAYPGVYTGNSISTLDPLFVNAATGNLSLQPCSPAINAGNNNSLGGAVTDLAGSPRLYNNGTVDIGAYEYQAAVIIPAAPTAASSQAYSYGTTVASLAATGTDLKWYTSALGGTALASGTFLNSGTYYVSQTATCESARTAVVVTITYPSILYVRTVATGTGSGTSWSNASSNLSAILTTGATEVWVAAGIYQPGSGQSFTMKEGMKVYGGFATTGSPVFGERSWAANETILRGNNNRVIDNNGNGLTNAALLDGFTITAGATGENGGGMRNINSYPAIRNCIFKNNTASNWGGALLNQGNGSTTITNCIFYSNSAGGGGAIFDNDSAATKYYNVTIANNNAVQNGGGIHTYQNSSITGYNCIIWGNTAGSANGKQLYSVSAAVTLNNSLILNNATQISGTFTGNALLQSDPLFINTGGGNFALPACSPAVNAGSNSYVLSGVNTDLAGNSRIYDSATADMGAYEYQGTGVPLPAASSQAFCGSATVANLTATGTSLQWYTASTGSTALAISAALSTGTYYVSQTVDGCESARTSVSVTVNPVPSAPIASAQNFCGSATVANLTVTGTALQWYTVSAGGSALATSTALSDGTYYASQTVGGCESTRTSVSITISALPSAPVAPSPQSFADNGGTVASLTATGSNLKWYTAQTGGTSLAPGNILSAGTYYVSQTVGCESLRSAVQVTITSQAVRYVKPVASGIGDGSSWANASADLQAMINASGAQQVWVAAGTHKPTTIAGNGATDRNKSFVLKNDVKVYGGFAGTETALGQRDWNANITILSGDLGIVNNTSDNAYHVVISAGDMGTPVLDGFTITKGNGNGSNDISVNGSSIQNLYGGGIYIYFSKPVLSNLVISSNNAQYGGGIYSVIGTFPMSNVVISNNTSPNVGGIHNYTSSPTLTNVTISGNTGTGIFNDQSWPVLTNVTISGNAGVGMLNKNTNPTITNVTISGNGSYGISSTGNSSPVLMNTIVYGNQSGILGGTPEYYNSLVQGITNVSNGNISGAVNPLFVDAPSYTTAPFSGGDHRLQGGSPAIDAGNTDYFDNAAASEDLAGTVRLYGTAIDMGAYEYIPYCTITTIWDGSEWNNGTPVSYEYSAVINGDHNSSEDGGITACSLTINDGDVIIAEGDNFTIKGIVIVYDVNASLTVQHNANLIQVDDVENTGTITVIKESAPMYRLDYALWASPVAEQKLKAFSTQTLDNRFYSYNPISDAYATVASPATTNMEEGKGYLIRVANNQPAYVSNDIAPTPWTGTFIGVPNNGTVAVPMIPFADVEGEDNDIAGYNAVGNPYPSSINIKAFFDANQNNLAEDTPIYFWRKKNEAGTSSYCSLTLAGYNQNAGNAFGDSSNGVFDNPNNSEDWVINPGQGFIVQATGSTLTFDNTMRVAVNNGQMFRTAQDEATEKSRLWLNLTNQAGAFSQATIAYTPFTTLDRDFGWDGKALTDGYIAIYSLAGDGKFGIQARPAFDPADEVPMEYKIDIAGSYTVSLDHFDGVFAEGQQIYLRDNLLDVTHDLESPYKFITEAGTITGRFDVVYEMHWILMFQRSIRIVLSCTNKGML